MQGEYKVFKVGEQYQIFYCPSAPVHYNDRVPYNGRMYPKRQAAYRRSKQLNEQKARLDAQSIEHVSDDQPAPDTLLSVPEPSA